MPLMNNRDARSLAMATTSRSSSISPSRFGPREPSSRRPAPTDQCNVPAPRQPRLRPSPILWPLLFCVSFGLGYPTLNRYDPQRLPYDARAYYALVKGAPFPAMADYSQ